MKWADADRISDKIVDLMNAEIKSGVGPVQVLAFVALIRTAPIDTMPTPIKFASLGVIDCLDSLVDSEDAV